LAGALLPRLFVCREEYAVLTAEQRAFANAQRVGRFATADQDGQPYVIPVCYACGPEAFYIPLDAKPKRVEPQRLKRVRNIQANPKVALVIDHYAEDWSELAYLLIRGVAGLLPPGAPEHQHAIALLRERYQQYQTMPIEAQPVIVIRPEAVVAWGKL
jgi:PPOX class probable F420-dependent enzyme